MCILSSIEVGLDIGKCLCEMSMQVRRDKYKALVVTAQGIMTDVKGFHIDCTIAGLLGQLARPRI